MPTWTIDIPRFHPTPLNKLLGSWRRAGRLKKADREMIGTYARLAGVPRATGKRRVSLMLTLAKGQRACDPDSPWKSVLDSLVACGLLLDDRRQTVEIGAIEFVRGPQSATRIILDDLYLNGEPS